MPRFSRHMPLRAIRWFYAERVTLCCLRMPLDTHVATLAAPLLLRELLPLIDAAPMSDVERPFERVQLAAKGASPPLPPLDMPLRRCHDAPPIQCAYHHIEAAHAYAARHASAPSAAAHERSTLRAGARFMRLFPPRRAFSF